MEAKNLYDMERIKAMANYLWNIFLSTFSGCFVLFVFIGVMDIKNYIGIDPGLSGAVCVLSDEIRIFDTPSTVIKSGKKNKRKYLSGNMADILMPFKDQNTLVIIEKQNAMPGQGVVSMMSIGVGYGLWLGIISAYKIPYIEITPQSWKKELMSGMGKEKAASCFRAKQLFPDLELFTPRGRALDGRGDAVLIAEYGRRKNL